MYRLEDATQAFVLSILQNVQYGKYIFKNALLNFLFLKVISKV